MDCCPKSLKGMERAFIYNLFDLKELPKNPESSVPSGGWAEGVTILRRIFFE